MSCDYCNEEKDLLTVETSNIGFLFWGIGKQLTRSSLEVTKHNLSVFIDRGYLRLVNPDDCNCMEHGEKIKINFCPMCGEKLIPEQKKVER